MRLFNNDNQGYTRGGLDVITAVNLFFKFLLLSPVFLLALFITVTMLKHMIFQGIPAMNKPTEEQEQRLRESDARIGEPAVIVPAPAETPVATTLALPPVQPVFTTTPSPKQLVEEARAKAIAKAESDAKYEATKFKRMCIEQWLPMHGNNPNAAGDPCYQFKGLSRLDQALSEVTR